MPGIPHHVVLLGYAGAGKSTHGKALAAQWQRTHLSTGDALRALRDHPVYGLQIQHMESTGTYASNQLACAAVNKHFDHNQGGVIFDGFPRNLAQTLWLDEKANAANIEAILFQITPEIATERLLTQRQRSDDTPALILKRHKIYEQQLDPVIAHYSKSNRLRTIDATLPPQDVLAQCLALYN